MMHIGRSASNIQRVVAAVSGGVDSSVATLLLQKKGFEVIGVYMKNWDNIDETGFCSGMDDAKDAEWVCKKLAIKFHIVNFTKEYWNNVFSELLSDYSSGFTPNPDILCNRCIKFDSLFLHAINNFEADALATGHYARTSYGEFLQYRNAADVHLLQSKDAVKDQTFFLSQVSQIALRQTMFPIGNLTKQIVKNIAKQEGLERIAKKKESMGICFIGSRKFQNFISQYLPPVSGHFINITNGEILGQHKGIHNWTIGQRCRLPGLRDRYFVTNKDSSSQTIFVAPGTDHPSLYSNIFFCSQPHWIHSNTYSNHLKDNVLDCQFRFQNTHALCSCTVISTNQNNLLVRLNHYMRALTPGQFAAFYKDGECIGSARIKHIGPSLYELGDSKSNITLCTEQMMKNTNCNSTDNSNTTVNKSQVVCVL